MTHSSGAAVRPKPHDRNRDLSDAELLDLVQRQTFRFFWEGAHPVSGLARDRSGRFADPEDDIVSVGGSGFGVLAVIVACQRGWVTRKDAVRRLSAMLDCLEAATCYHGMFPHLMNGATGATIRFSRKDDGADIVETSLLFQGLLCARTYFNLDDPEEMRLRGRVTYLWQEAEWDWFVRHDRKVLTWHWSPNNGWALDHEIRGWNECLITYVLAASAPRYSISLQDYHEGWTQGRNFLNGRKFHEIDLPLGPNWGGPLFFAHFSFCGIDPRGLCDAYADYWRQNVNHTLINYTHCVRNPHGYKGYGPTCWGLTASDTVSGYAAHAPDNDLGVISPAAALASFPYAPAKSMEALRNFYENLGDRIWGRFGFVDAFSEENGWYADTYLAISQGPIVAMIENYRSGLLWRLFMTVPEIQAGLRKLGFSSP
jgi:hypothetical protein